MHDVLPFLLQHGYVVLFLCVLAETAGAPIPAVPVLLGIGALAGLGRMPITPAVGLSLLACLLSDSLWYWLGRRRGASILRILCAISLEPDSCVSTTKRTFARLGASSLLFAKFIPGLSTAATPMAGVTKMPYWRFLLADGAGALIWSGAYFTIGWIFRLQIGAIGERVMGYGGRVGLVVVLLLAAYIGFKFWQRQRYLHSLRIARVSPEDVLSRIENGEELTILDLRNRLEVESSGNMLPGAVWYDQVRLDENHLEIPRDRDIILYCS
jgi:membrane protein DedA with SNARE-associated domain